MTEIVGEGDGFRLEKSDTRVTLVATGPWSSAASEALDSGKADGLDLNYAKGFKDTGLSFVQAWPVRRVDLLARTVKDITPLYRLASTLESLSVQTAPSAVIDLSSLPHLTSLSADWDQIRESIGSAAQLRDLFVLCYAETNLIPLSHLTSLRRLRMKDRPRVRSLDGVDALPALEHLGVYLARDLVDIDSLRWSVPSPLVELHVESCRGIREFDAISSCNALRVFNASDCGDVVSLAPLRNLDKLEMVWLFGTTNVLDGDLAPLAGLPRLTELRMRSRRDYRPSVEDVTSLIADRTSQPN